MHDRDMDGLGECSCVADLHGHLLRRPMQHGLAVKADDIDVLAREAVLRGKSGHPLGKRDPHPALRPPPEGRPRPPPPPGYPLPPEPGAPAPARSGVKAESGWA